MAVKLDAARRLAAFMAEVMYAGVIIEAADLVTMLIASADAVAGTADDAIELQIRYGRFGRSER